MLCCCDFWTQHILGTPCFRLGSTLSMEGVIAPPLLRRIPQAPCINLLSLAGRCGMGFDNDMFISSFGAPKHLYFWVFIGNSLSCNHWLWQSWSGNEAEFRSQWRTQCSMVDVPGRCLVYETIVRALCILADNSNNSNKQACASGWICPKQCLKAHSSKEWRIDTLLLGVQG